MRFIKLWPGILPAALSLLVGIPAAAQTHGGLKSLVVDKQGEPIPGATVVVTNHSTGVARGGLTDSLGICRFMPLPPGGGYSLKVVFPGMATLEMSDVDITAGVIASVTIVLVPETDVQARVRIVYHLDTIDPAQTATQTRFTSEFIDALPILGRNYQDFLALAPGVTDVDGDGNPNIHGARDTDVVTLVDGASTVDPLTAKIGQQLNIDSIQEIEVKTSGASAEYGRGQGGFINIVTKSGSNEFAGNFKFFVRSSRLDGGGHSVDDPRLHGRIGRTELEFEDLRPFVSVGGPLKKDTAWYFATAEYVRLEEPIRATTQNFVRGTTEQRAFGKLTWSVASNHRLTFSVTIDPQEYDNQGVDSLTREESGYSERLGGTNLLLKETAIFSPSVFLESTVQKFESRPRWGPNLDPDTNGNGILFIDRNQDGQFGPTERDPGDDWDGDGAWDVFEDANHEGTLNAGEDRDGDGRLTRKLIGCEGATREDQDCDGHLDVLDEDTNRNHRLDYGEDMDLDGRLDEGGEDRNGNGRLDDRPFPHPTDDFDRYLPNGVRIDWPSYYPYDRFRPLAGDRDYLIDEDGITSGPFYIDLRGTRGRVTLREDLAIFVPDLRGQHDLKIGGSVEREGSSQDIRLRPVLMPNGSDRRTGQASFIGVQLASEASNVASGQAMALYVQDTYKPIPNLTLGGGLRFDRETIDSSGYTPFDPVAEKGLSDRLRALGMGEPIGWEDILGNGDGVRSLGFCSDPIFAMPGFQCRTNNFGNPVVADLMALRRLAIQRLTQPHTLGTLGSQALMALYPDSTTVDPSTQQVILDVEALRRSATFQEPESFRLTNNNLAPRLFISCDPFGDSKTKIFLNWGRFYDKLFLDSVVREQGPDTISRYYRADHDGLTESGTPNNGFGPLLSAAPPSAALVDRSLRTPFADELTVGFERELAPEVALKITYVNRAFRYQLQDRDINHTFRNDANGRPIDVLGHYASAGAQVPDDRPDLFVNNAFFNQVLFVGNINTARYRGLEVELTKRLSRKWQMQASYTYSRAVGAAEEYLSPLGDDPSVVQDEFGYLDYDQRHVVKINAAAYLPGDWQIGAVMSWASGLPFSIVDRFVAADNLGYEQFRTFYGYADRMNGTYVSVGRNSGRNKASMNINVRAQKAIVMGHFNSKLFVSVDNLLNADDVRIFSLDRNDAAVSQSGRVVSERRFGRRYELGVQLDF
ncbi:MAG TPA: carboxypeptidase regulatory-like domain-containing protein [Candidatus Polarisedimenticolia bacterium]|jgi:outer membrane receptor protein involved in Fe transport|nr:carboxypeptidase regulatory-like domain-containing protein [Candidatus Polarisedimenticolia bacterium]